MVFLQDKPEQPRLILRLGSATNLDSPNKFFQYKPNLALEILDWAERLLFLRTSTLGQNITSLKILAESKCSSLLQASDRKKTFKTMTPVWCHRCCQICLHFHSKKSNWDQCYKTFYVRNLQVFLISQSVCPWQAFPAQSNV